MKIKVLSVLSSLVFFMPVLAGTSSGTIDFSASVISPVCHFQIKDKTINQQEIAYLKLMEGEKKQDEHCQMPVVQRTKNDKTTVRHGSGYIVSGGKTKIIYLAYQ